jgi:hypothetical protein
MVVRTRTEEVLTHRMFGATRQGGFERAFWDAVSCGAAERRTPIRCARQRPQRPERSTGHVWAGAGVVHVVMREATAEPDTEPSISHDSARLEYLSVDFPRVLCIRTTARVLAMRPRREPRRKWRADDPLDGVIVGVAGGPVGTARCLARCTQRFDARASDSCHHRKDRSQQGQVMGTLIVRSCG